MFTYVIIIIGDKIRSVKCCELSTVIITVHAICQLGGCIYSLDCMTGVIPMMVFPVCGYGNNHICKDFNLLILLSLKP